jgi:hypothetical protein
LKNKPVRVEDIYIYAYMPPLQHSGAPWILDPTVLSIKFPPFLIKTLIKVKIR